MPSSDLAREAERLMVICNACRYCEGHCAVFPAMELRIAFPDNDLRYLANLCHDCRACFHHCQYAPPHEFDVNVPKVLGELRRESYRRHAWPRFLSPLFEHGPVLTTVASVASVVLLAVLAIASGGPSVLVTRHGPGRFYDVLSHAVMVDVFGIAGIFAVAAFLVGFARFWRDAGDGALTSIRSPEVVGALRDTMALRYLDGGGGDGCTYPNEPPSKARRWFHHFTFYGFLLCYASTCSGTVYHSLGLIAPYGWMTVPVILGTLGGIGLVVGTIGLYALKRRSDREPLGRGQLGLDVPFLVLLLLITITGFALLAFRATAGMGVLLIVHLGLVLALFLTMPYGKFVHAIYRFAALIRYARERSRPPPRIAPEA